MSPRSYYSNRTGHNLKPSVFGLTELLKVFRDIYGYLDGEGYFQEYLGFECVDAGPIAGLLGSDIETEILLYLRKKDLWPVYKKVESYTEDDLFDMIEFLHDNISKPTQRKYHDYNDCGWHCSEFNQQAGQSDLREKLNKYLRHYKGGFEIAANGNIQSIPSAGLEPLVGASIPKATPKDITGRIEAAVAKFRRARANIEDRRDAIRDLVDVLEFLRPKAKEVLQSEDERELFNLANNFGIRHHNSRQKQVYDKPIWYSWMFYHYLATIHALLRLIEKGAPQAPSKS